jgi:hypothetical protein
MTFKVPWDTRSVESKINVNDMTQPRFKGLKAYLFAHFIRLPG